MKQWEKKEQQDSKAFQGNLQKGSGNTWAHPGDIKNTDFLIDSKQTDKKSYSISRATWEKIASEALFTFKYPMLSLSIQGIELIVLSKEDFFKLVPQKKS